MGKLPIQLVMDDFAEDFVPKGANGVERLIHKPVVDRKQEYKDYVFEELNSLPRFEMDIVNGVREKIDAAHAYLHGVRKYIINADKDDDGIERSSKILTNTRLAVGLMAFAGLAILIYMNIWG